MTQTYFRVQPGNFDPQWLLDPECQTSNAWSRDDRERRGVSVCDSRETLAAYLAGPGAGIPYGAGGWLLVELEGDESDDTPLDAEHGELLVHPTRVVAADPIDAEMWDMIGAAFDANTEEH